MAQPARYDFQVKRRADYPLRLQIKDGLKQAVDLTGFTVFAQVWDQSRTQNYAAFETEYTDRLEGRITLWLNASDTASLPDDSWYDVLVIDPSGHKQYYLEGVIYAQEGYTELA
jgi:hypothetical protein